MRVFITGGTGCVGQYCTKTLLDAGHEVVLLTRTPDRIPALKTLPRLTLVQGSTDNLEILEKAVQGCDAVIYIALTLGRDPYSDLMNDTRPIVFLLTAAEKAGVKSFIYTSSEAVNIFEKTEPVLLDETSETRPGNIYGAQKAAAEAYVRGFTAYLNPDGFQNISMRRNIVRPGHVYSFPAFEGGAADSVPTIEEITRKILHNEDVELPPESDKGGHFIAGQQIAQLYLKILESDVNNEVFFGAGKEYVSYNQIAEYIKEKYVPESTSRIIPDPNPDGHWSLKTDKIRKYFGLDFTGMEYMDAHIQWILDRIHREERGETLYNTRHSEFPSA